jgi:hypothetical protein
VQARYASDGLEVLVNVSAQLEKSELTGLENVAEGRASAVPEHVVSRLLAMGLVQPSANGMERGPAGHGLTLQLTPKGLSVIRSSDQ